MGVVLPVYLFDSEGFSHVFAVANGEYDGMAFVRQCINHADAEIAQSRVVWRWKPTQQVQDIH